jgi:hypothetical protein
MTCPSCGAEIADPDGIYCSRCGRPLGSSEGEVTERLAGPETDRDLSIPEADDGAPNPRPSAVTTDTTQTAEGTARPEPTAARTEETHRADVPPEDSTRSPSAAAMATEMVASLRRALGAGRWTEAASAASMGFLAVLGVGALFVGLLKLVDPTFGTDRSPLWVLTRVVIAGLASLGIPFEQGGAGDAILPMGTLVLVAWALIWAARTIVASRGGRRSGERALDGAKVGVPFGLLCWIAALVFRLREGVDTGVDPSLALVIGALWGGLFGAAGGLLAERSPRSTPSEDSDVDRPGPLKEGVMAGATMLLTAVVAAMAAALIFVIVNLIVGRDLRLTAGDAVAVVILLVAFAPNIAVGTLAFSMGTPVEFVADSLGVGFRTDFSLFEAGSSGPEWSLYLAVLIPLSACLFGGYAARRRTNHPHKMIEIVAVAAATLSISLSFLVYIGNLSLERVLVGQGNLLVLAPDASAAFFLALVWAGVLGIIGWKVAESQPRPAQDPSDSRSSKV